MCAEKTTLKVPTHITMPLGYQVADDNDEVSIISSVTTKLDDSSRWEELAKDPSLNSLSCLPNIPIVAAALPTTVRFRCNIHQYEGMISFKTLSLLHWIC